MVLRIHSNFQKIIFKTGFTILEMLISVVLLVVGTVAVLSMFGTGIIADAGIEKSTVALALAQEEMELIKGADSWDAIDCFASPRTNIGGDYPDFDREVAVDGDPKTVRVLTYWTARGTTQTVELATLFTNYNY